MAYLIEDEPLTVPQIRKLSSDQEAELVLAKRIAAKKTLLTYLGSLASVGGIFSLQWVFFDGFSAIFTLAFTISFFWVLSKVYVDSLYEAVDDIDREIRYLRPIPMSYNTEILEWCHRVPEIRNFADKVATLDRGFIYREYVAMRRYDEIYDEILAGREVFRNRTPTGIVAEVEREPSADGVTSSGVRKVNIN
jgi:hypothetical protein